MKQTLEKKCRIIIADDHDLFRTHLKSLIKQKKDCELLDEVTNGRLLIEALEKTRYDIVLLDITMPELDGFLALDIIKEKFPDLKIIMLTMHIEDSYKKIAQKKGADAFILKTQIFDNIFKAIDAVSQGKKYFIDES